MGMSASATLAWGVNLSQGEYGDIEPEEVAAKVAELLEDDWDLARLFGEGNPAPVELDYYGSYDYGGKVLLIKRTYTRAHWGLNIPSAEKLTPPTEAEAAALNKALDAIGFQGDRTPKLLLFAMYG